MSLFSSSLGSGAEHPSSYPSVLDGIRITNLPPWILGGHSEQPETLLKSGHMIREVDQSTFSREFFALMAEVKCGNRFDFSILRFSEAYGREQGAYCQYVVTYAGAQGTIAFYQRNGFEIVATLPDVHGPKVAGNVYMRKILRR